MEIELGGWIDTVGSKSGQHVTLKEIATGEVECGSLVACRLQHVAVGEVNEKISTDLCANRADPQILPTVTINLDEGSLEVCERLTIVNVKRIVDLDEHRFKCSENVGLAGEGDVDFMVMFGDELLNFNQHGLIL